MGDMLIEAGVGGRVSVGVDDVATTGLCRADPKGSIEPNDSLGLGV